MTPPATAPTAAAIQATGGDTRTFPGTPDQVRHARRFLAGLLGDDDLAHDAVTCLSELASNACLHSASGQPGGTFTVRVLTQPGQLRIEVTDGGGPWITPRHQHHARGRGLAIVAALATQTGITGTDTGRTAWATFTKPAQPEAPASAGDSHPLASSRP
jgi:serine/threonine-protein kinase RsbW